jgi:hypothetical protein
MDDVWEPYTCEYLCNMYSCVEDEQLQFIKSAKQNEAMQFAETDLSDDDAIDFTLPASFTGSRKYFADRTADSLALSHQLGKPNLLITTTTIPIGLNFEKLWWVMVQQNACRSLSVFSGYTLFFLSLNDFHTRHDFQNL